MSEEQHNEETEVEGHGYGKLSHPKQSANDEPRDEAEGDEVEGHGFGKVSHPKVSHPKVS
jgi:hypothetical protein